MAATIIDFSKETKNFSITKNGLKTSYTGNPRVRLWPQSTEIAQIQVPEFPTIMSNFSVNTTDDTITIAGIAFSGDATDLCDRLRDEVFIAD